MHREASVSPLARLTAFPQGKYPDSVATMSNAMPVLVVGAGATGLTMAGELARHGAPVRIVDKLPGILPYCRATTIHSRTLEIFQDFGVIDEFLADGQSIRGLNEYASGTRMRHERFDAVDSPYGFAIAIEQFRTEDILERRLERLGVRVEREVELIALDECEVGLLATLRDRGGREERAKASWVVGCDGARSTVRRLRRADFPGETDVRRYVLADALVESELAKDEIHAFLSDRGAAWALPIPGGRSLLVSDVGEHGEAFDKPTPEQVVNLMVERGFPPARVHGVRWTSHFHIHYRLAPHYRFARTFLAGDAAHVHSLVGGQGMNTGIQDAYNLAWKLASVVRGRAPESLLESYEIERRAIARDVLETTKRATEEAEAFSGLSLEERDRHYFHASISDGARLRARRHREELDLDYRRSPICFEDWEEETGGPHAGAQSRDARPLQAGNRTVSLFELLRGPQHHLLLFAGDSEHTAVDARFKEIAAETGRLSDGAVAATLIRASPATPATASEGDLDVVYDADRCAHGRYGANRACLYLLRPDGYVGYRARVENAGRLHEYLAAIFAPSAAT